MKSRRYNLTAKGHDHREPGANRYAATELYGTLVDVTNLPDMECRYYKIPSTGKILVFCEHVEKVPILNKVYTSLSGFKYFRVTRYLDIINEKDKITPEAICLDFIEECRGDPDR